jgi:hypothetical protein
LARKWVWARKRAAGGVGPSARPFDEVHALFASNPGGAGRKTADLDVESSLHGPTMPRRFLLELDGFRHDGARPDFEDAS